MFSEKIRKGRCRVMTVEIAKVKRVDGKAVRLVAWIGDIKSKWIRRPDTGKPYEESRRKVGVQVLDQDTLWIPPGDYGDLCRMVYEIFSEVRPVKSHRPRKKRTKVSKKRNQEVLQGKLF